MGRISSGVDEVLERPKSPEKPVHPGQFNLPQCPQNLNDQQKRQFSMFINMKLQQHKEKINKFNEDIAKY